MKKVDLVVIGGGPAGLCATINAASSGVNVLLVERDKKLGGQLVKQTHMFFGSEKQHAATRGIDISTLLFDKIKEYKENIKIMTDTTVLGVYEDGVITLENKGKYIKIEPKSIIVATGASEKSLAFPGNDLPGVYGAGAVQTLMNVHGVKPGDRALMVGAGNIGLIVAYQLIQAGVDIAAVIHHSPRIGGYFVHASKLTRMGVPIYTNHSMKQAIGDRKLEKAIIWEVDEKKKPIEGSEKELDVDFICVSVGLSPLIELLAQAGCELKYDGKLSGLVPVKDENYRTTKPGIFVAGDASGVEEASMAMVEGYLAGLCAAKDLGYPHKDFDNLKLDYTEQLKALRAGPEGLNRRIDAPSKEVIVKGFPTMERIKKGPVAVIECFQNIPCNPCTTACKQGAITMEEDINDLPLLERELCNGCSICISKCPGLAIMVVDGSHSEDEIVFRIPYEFRPLPNPGDMVKGIDRDGKYLTNVKVIKVVNPKSFDRTPVVHVSVDKDFLYDFRNIELGVM